MTELSSIERVFSITNQNGIKEVCIFGCVFKISKKFIFNLKYKHLPIEQNKIVFVNFKGGGYGCNPKYIAEEIIRQNLPYKMVWLVKDVENAKLSMDIPSNIKLVPFRSAAALKELATAKIWIDNQRKIYHVRRGLNKKEGQYYIQTWHGSLGIKKVGAEANTPNTEDSWLPFAIEDSKMTDYILSNSTFDDQVFEKNFWGYGNIIKLGHPRNDIFFKDNTLIKDRIYKKYNLDKDTKVLLYVPSFRDDYRLYCYNLEYKNILKAVEKRFGGNWVLMIRLHPNLIKYTECLIPPKDNIINVTEYPDIQEILAISDIAITDYSSCIFDFMLSGKPGFLFANDIEDFDKDRGFYYPLESTPFPLAKCNDEMVNNIKNFDLELYQKNVKEFLQSKGCMEDGLASQRVVSLIQELVNK
ncbi:CDP-glycerol--poly(glycerophosphate) glycerophosphotransferase [bacterium]|nr:CDP-glycerol--poly(glycerophosphate) glycerophosphotransferase [bacterium]